MYLASSPITNPGLSSIIASPNENQQREIRALATYELGGSRYLLAGIIEGVFRLKLGENAWEDFNTNLESKKCFSSQYL